MAVNDHPGARPEPEFAAFLGIDWADQKHDWAWQEAAGEKRMRSGQFASTPEAIHAWVAEIHATFGDRPVAVALEQSRGSLLFQLMNYIETKQFEEHLAEREKGNHLRRS